MLVPSPCHLLDQGQFPGHLQAQPRDERLTVFELGNQQGMSNVFGWLSIRRNVGCGEGSPGALELRRACVCEKITQQRT